MTLEHHGEPVKMLKSILVYARVVVKTDLALGLEQPPNSRPPTYSVTSFSSRSA